MRHLSTAALACALAVLCAMSCTAAQDRASLQLTAITAGCKASLDLEHDAGAAGAADATSKGCEAALHTLDVSP